MRARLFGITALIVVFMAALAMAQEPAVSEQETSRPDRQESVAWMRKTAAMPDAQQSEKLDSILRTGSESATPRSDFFFCLGLAYRGNGKAQQCVARAYEKGLGVVEDLAESYVWFALAHAGHAAGAEADMERVKTLLVSVYPAPTDEELEEQVAAQKSRLQEYQAEVRKSKK